MGTAYVYRGGAAFDLSSLVSDPGVWTLHEARALNDAGQILAVGEHDGQNVVVLLTPDAP